MEVVEAVEADQVLQVTTVAVAWEVLKKSWCNSRNVHLHGENLMWSCHHLGNWPLWRGRGRILGVWWRLALCSYLFWPANGFDWFCSSAEMHGGAIGVDIIDLVIATYDMSKQYVHDLILPWCPHTLPFSGNKWTLLVASSPWTLGRRRLIRTPHITKRTRRQSKKGVIRRRPKERPWLCLGSTIFCARFAKAASLLFCFVFISLWGCSKLTWTIRY